MLKLRVSKKDTTKSRVFPTNGWRRPIPLSRNGNSLITPSTNSIPGLPQIVEQNKNKTSLWKRWNPHWENSKTSSRKRRGLSITYKNFHAFVAFFILDHARSCHHCQLLFITKKIIGTVTQ